MNIVQGESGAWAVHHGGKHLWGPYETEEEARDAADAGIARMFKNRSERLLRFLDLTKKPGVPVFCITDEIRLITAAMEEVEARWGNSSIADECLPTPNERGSR